MLERQRVIAVTALVLSASTAQAGSFDGAYTGTISCGLLTGLSKGLKTEFSMTVKDGQATYERQIIRPTGPTGAYERGGGKVTAAGDVSLRGRGEGSFVFDARPRSAPVLSRSASAKPAETSAG
jgi:hypothetical protein